MTHDHRLRLTQDDMAPRTAVCPTCDSGGLKAFDRARYHDSTLRFDICGDCNLVFMNPHPTQAWYDRLYSGEFWEVKSLRQSGSTVNRNLSMWQKSLKRSKKLARFLERGGFAPPKGGRILEVGSAYGLIVSDLASRFECQANGVEPNHAARAFSEHFVDVSPAAESMAVLAEWEGCGSVDMMIFSHVLENIIDLDGTFATIRRVLKPGGRVLIDTPNIYFPRTTHIYHPYSFCEVSLRTLLNKHGFKIDHCEASGAARTVMSPQYLSVLATMVETDGAEPPRGGTALARERMWLGHIWFAIAARFPLNYIDGLISSRLYKLDRPAEDRLAVLETAVNKAENE